MIKVDEAMVEAFRVEFYGEEQSHSVGPFVRERIGEALQAALATQPQGEAGELAACQPWADYHGNVPDWDSPLHAVFVSGMTYAERALAKVLCVESYSPCEGTECFDGDFEGTLFNIVLEAMPRDADGDPLTPREVHDALRNQPAVEAEPPPDFERYPEASRAYVESLTPTAADDALERAAQIAEDFTNPVHGNAGLIIAGKIRAAKGSNGHG